MARPNQILYEVRIDASSGEASLVKLQGVTGKTESTLAKLRQSMSRGLELGGGLEVVRGITGALTGIGGAAIEFDKNVRSIGSLGVQNFRAIGDELLVLSKDIPKTAGELANATYQAISSGITSDKVIPFVEQAAKVAVAGQATTAEAVDGITSVLNAYKLKTEEAATVSDQFFGAINIGKTTFPEMNRALAQAVPISASVGVGFDQVSAAIAQMTNLGVPTAQSANKIEQALVELQKPGKTLAGVMEAAGVSLDMLKDPSIGLIGVLDKITVQAAKQGLSVTQVFSSIEAGGAAMLLAGDNLESARGTLDKIRGAAGSTDQAFNVMNESLESQITLAQNLVSSALLPVAQTLLGGFLTGVKAAGSAITSLGGFVSTHKTAFVALGAAVGILTLAMNASAISAGIAGKAKILWAATTGGVTTAIKLLNLAMATSPLGVFAAAALGVVGVIALFSGGAKELGDAIEDSEKSLEDFNKANGDASKIEENANKTKTLADRYDELAKKEKLSAEEKTELDRVTQDLSVATGGATAVVDEYGKTVAIATDEVRALAGEQLELAAAMREGAALNLQDQTQGLIASLDETMSKQADLRKDIAETKDSGVGLWDAITGDFAGGAEDVREMRKELGGLGGDALKGIQQLARAFDAAFQGQTLTLDLVKSKFQGSDKVLKDAIAAATLLRNSSTQAQSEAAAKERSTKAVKERKKTEEDLLALAKRLADEATNQYEIDRKLELLRTGRKFTAEEELKLQQEALANLKKEIDARSLLSNKKYALKAQLSIDQAELKTIELKVRLAAEFTKFREDFDANVAELRQKEIDLGIRPRSETLTAFKESITKLEGELLVNSQAIAQRAASVPFGMLDSVGQELLLKNQELKGKLLDAEGGFRDASLAIARELSDLRIENMSSEQQREIALLGKQFEADTQFVRDAIDSGRELDEGEKKLKEQLEIRYGKRLKALRAKHAAEAAKDEISITKGLYESLTKGLESFLVQKKRLSEAEFDDKKLSYEKQDQELRRNLLSGEISNREYNIRLAKLTEERVAFENEQNQSGWAAFIGGLQNAYNSALGAIGSYFDSLFQKYVIDAAMTEIMEGTKTASTATGVTTRVALNEVESASNLKTAASSGVKGAAEVAASTITSLGWLGIPVAALAALAFTKLIQGLVGLIGFEHGGLGIVGEGGQPEIIGPTKDFSEFAAQLVLRTVTEVVKALNTRGGGGSEVGVNSKIEVQGRLVGTGRDLEGVLVRNSISNRSETFGEDKSIRMGSFIN